METTMTWTWSEMNCSATSYGPPVYLSPGEEVYLAIPRTLANGGSGGGGRAVVHKLIILIVLSVSAPHL